MVEHRIMSKSLDGLVLHPKMRRSRLQWVVLEADIMSVAPNDVISSWTRNVFWPPDDDMLLDGSAVLVDGIVVH
jgi:hypothetical protein